MTQIISLFITIDSDTEQLISDLQSEVSRKTQDVADLKIKLRNDTADYQNKLLEASHELAKALDRPNQEVENLTTKLKLTKNKLVKLTSDNTELNEQLINQKKALIIVNKNHESVLEAEKNKKYKLMAQVSALEGELEELKTKQQDTPSLSSEQYQQSKLKYSKLLERFEKLVDTNNALKHEFTKLEEKNEALTDKIEKASSGRNNNSIGSTTTTPTTATSTRLGNKISNGELDKLRQEIATLKQDHKAQIIELKGKNLKLINHKDQTERELAKLKRKLAKNASSNSTSTVADLEVSSPSHNTTSNSNNKQKHSDLENQLTEVKTQRNRLIRESNKQKQRADNALEDNNKKVERIKELKKTIEKLKKEKNGNSGLDKKEEDLIVLDRAKQEEMIHWYVLCVYLVGYYSNANLSILLSL